MKLADRLPVILVVSMLLFGAGAVVVPWIRRAEVRDARVTVADLSTVAIRGKKSFDANCAQCHGSNGTGTQSGPPLIHDIYNPGHHGDEAFFRAAKQGVPQHHWSFGNMPARPGVSDEELAAIVTYIREMQEENGIFYRPHNM